MANLFETILSSLPANAGDLLGSHFGESPDAAIKGLSGIVPLLLSAFAGKAASGGDIGGLVSMLTKGLAGGNPLDNPAAALAPGGSAGGLGDLAGQLLGSNMAPVVAAVAGLFGLKGSTVNGLMSMAGPLVAGGLGKLLGANPSVDGVRNLLISEKDSFASALPAEIRRLVSPVASAATAAVPVVEEAAKPGTWKWLLLGLAVLGLLGWLFFGRGHKEAPVSAPADTAAVETAPVTAPAPVVAPPGAGVAAEEREGRPVLIVFFDVAKSEVSNDLAAESAAVKAYVDAHPDARVSVSGFNDPTGDAAANAALAKTRAENVKAALVAAGFAADRIDLDKPAEATDTSESYAGARRVEVTVKG